MVNISKRRLKPHFERTIIQQLVDHVSRVRGRRSSEFLSEFLTPTERIQLGKRITAILMLLEGYSFTQIEKALEISPTTVVKLWQELKDGKFPTISAMCTFGRTVHERSALDALLSVLAKGLPPRAGKGRWKFLQGR
jgi:uncharacterized protein YerC